MPASPAFDLGGRVALVTGSSRGIGRSLADGLAAAGATVVLNGLDKARLDRTRAELAERHGGDRVHASPFDITDEDQVTAAVAGVEGDVGPIDVLVNNAGIIHVSPLSEQARSAWDVTLAVNLTGAMLGIQAVVRRMRTHGGSVINVASIFGVVGAPGYAAYCASKAGLIALTKVAALELAQDRIRVNAIVPGGVSTPMNEHEKEGGVVPDTPLRRRAHPSEISGAVVFLASDDSSFVTGSELVVDGGYLAR
jgi:3alpha(or 20beta)-hydroxysteroid dehydrogenase